MSAPGSRSSLGRGAIIAIGLFSLLGGCARTTEIVGRLVRDGGGGGGDVDAAVDAVDASVDAPPPALTCGDHCYRAAGVTADPSAFDATPVVDPARQPALVYPLAGAVVPVNLGTFTLQWRRASAAQSSFRVRFAGPGLVFDLLLPCDGAGAVAKPATVPAEACLFALPPDLFATIAGPATGKTLSVAITALESGRPPVASVPANLEFSVAPVGGGLYFWSRKTLGISRALIGSLAAADFVPGSAAPVARFGCVGCHAVSRDGSTLALDAESDGYASDGNLVVTSTATPMTPTIPAPATPMRNAATMAVSPNGRLVLVSAGPTGDSGHAVVKETATGAVVATLDGAALAGTGGTGVYFPEWSPAGDELVATVARVAPRPFSVSDGSIVVWHFDGVNFGPPDVLVAGNGGESHYAPTWSPSGKYIAFITGEVGAGISSYLNPRSRLRIIARSSGVGGAVDLIQATQNPAVGVGWPHFAPFGEGDGARFYLTFESHIDYGYLRRNTAEANRGLSQLWLTAIDMTRLNQGIDPSRPPVWLPFQDPNFSNLMGVWAERLVCGPQSPCDPGMVCTDSQCLVAH